MNHGPTSFRLGLRGMPNAAESDIVRRDISLARETGSHIHVAHISTAEAMEAVRQAKKAGIRATAEVTPHHFNVQPFQGCVRTPPARPSGRHSADTPY